MTYKLLRPDFLVVTAETGTGKSYIRYAAGDAGLRGLTLGYDKALTGEVDRLAIAIANSFVPFPEAAPAAAAAPVGDRRSGARTRRPCPAAVRPRRRSASSLAPGRVLASAGALSGCRGPLVAGQTGTDRRRRATAELLILETGAPLAGRSAIHAEPSAGSGPPAGRGRNRVVAGHP